MRNKRLRLILSGLMLSVLMIALLPFPAFADDLFVYTNPQTGFSVYIDDGYDLLTDEEETALVEDMKPITEYGNAGFISCENYDLSTSSYSAQKYAALFGSESGTLLVIDMGMREFYIK